MRIATFNVNSIRAREERLLAFLRRHPLDVVCLQELKVEDAGFPLDAVRAAGFESAVFGQKTYNGVAILSRTPMTDVARGFGDAVDDPQARFLGATVNGVRILNAYFPNGSEVGSEKYFYKLAWMKRLRAFLDRSHTSKDPVILTGDFNVAPDDKDVARPDAWRESVLCHETLRVALEEVKAFGFVDTFRKHNPDGGIYSWWDYRLLSFPKGDGLRIDHVFATDCVAARSREAIVDREERKGKQPSDHAPMIVTFDD